jgi:hypothetical protein
MPCKTSPAPTPLQLSLQCGLKIAEWMRALSALDAHLALAAGGEAVEPIVARLVDPLQTLMQDEELTADALAAEAIPLLLQHDPTLAADLARALVSGDRRLGRARFLAVFIGESQGDNRSG